MKNSGLNFSETELEILRLITLDYSNKEIADKLFLSVSTIKWYIASIYKKLSVHSRVKASLIAYKNGIISE